MTSVIRWGSAALCFIIDVRQEHRQEESEPSKEIWVILTSSLLTPYNCSAHQVAALRAFFAVLQLVAIRRLPPT